MRVLYETMSTPTIPQVRPAFVWRILGLFVRQPGSLASPAADVLMAGGASLLLFAILKLTVPKTADTSALAAALYYAAFLVNYPHFAASYQLLYADAGKDFFSYAKHPWFTLKLWWAGVVVPLLLIGYLGYAMLQPTTAEVGYLVNAMYFFVGWHYVKQIFGCVIVLSTVKKVFYTRFERWCILAPLYSLWLLNYAAANRNGDTYLFAGMPYSHLALPDTVIMFLSLAFVVTSLGMCGMWYVRLIQRKPMPPVSAVAAILSIYVWFTPVHNTPSFLLIIPLFHSLQYLLFVLAYKSNETLGASPASAKRILAGASGAFLVVPALVIAVGAALHATGNLEEGMVAVYGMIMTVSTTLWMRTLAFAGGLILALLLLQRLSRKSSAWKFWRFLTHMLLLGAVVFSIAPTALDILASNKLLPTPLVYNSTVLGSSFYLFAFFVFVNIHHYFIDNVLWRRDNPHVREHLFH